MVVGLKNGQLHGKAILKDQEGVGLRSFPIKMEMATENVVCIIHPESCSFVDIWLMDIEMVWALNMMRREM